MKSLFIPLRGVQSFREWSGPASDIFIPSYLNFFHGKATIMLSTYRLFQNKRKVTSRVVILYDTHSKDLSSKERRTSDPAILSIYDGAFLWELPTPNLPRGHSQC